MKLKHLLVVNYRLCSGKIEHYKAITGKRRMDTEDKLKFAEKLKHEKPAKVYYENASDLKDAALTGKKNHMHSIASLQRLREKVT